MDSLLKDGQWDIKIFCKFYKLSPLGVGKKKLEFQLALKTSTSKILLAPGKS